jgi:hypothetical protein
VYVDINSDNNENDIFVVSDIFCYAQYSIIIIKKIFGVKGKDEVW